MTAGTPPVPAADIPPVPLARTCPFAPREEYTRLRGEQPVSRVRMAGGNTAWLLTRYADVRSMLSDPRFGSDRAHPGFPLFTPGQAQAVKAFPQSIGSLDGAAHARARRAVAGEFTVRRVAGLRPRAERIVEDRLDDLLSSRERPVDLVSAFSLPVASLVICELLGVPYDDHEYFQARTDLYVDRGTDRETWVRAVTEIRQYLDGLVRAKEGDPGDDLISRLVAGQRAEPDPVYDHDGLVNLAWTLLIAGHETTASMISLSTMALLMEGPERRAAMARDPALVDDAVEEWLRYFTIAEVTTSRTALEDVVIGGVTIRAGEGVIGLGSTANRDPEVFEDPDTLNLTRGRRDHLAFGYGPHQCLGANLARLELRIALQALLRRIPGLRLAVEVERLRFKEDANVYGLVALPVSW
ncbi:cytochrome P450 [Actinomadura macrotermitis]|uniref:Vitamin D3 dihydroxylase n=1 Tax=Actinomadura macrotermitis TaxID=2585200 RepID=A0A7K0BVZ7_9ACTN|nr:cytochrome P450 [Actinomadura macrotermitis]MQY05072.1 Vitamin D3 dihydroxylase [Actinomadura macrotermitis]